MSCLLWCGKWDSTCGSTIDFINSFLNSFPNTAHALSNADGDTCQECKYDLFRSQRCSVPVDEKYVMGLYYIGTP